MRVIVRSLCLSAFFCFSCLEANTLLVTSLNDSGAGTFRDAITNAGPSDNIEFDAALSGTITLQSPLPTIALSIQVKGPDSRLVTLSGNDLYPLFNVQTRLFTVNQLNLSHGVRAGGGGVAYVDDNNYAKLSNLSITLSDEPDGINPLYADLEGTFLLNDVTFTSSDTSEIYLNQGAMYIANTLTTNSISIVDGVASQILTDGDRVDLSAASISPIDLTISVQSGITSFTGTTTSPLMTSPDATLYGTYITNALVNLGICQFGNPSTIAQCQATDQYYQDSLATLQIKIDPTGNKDQLVTGGTVLLSGTLTILPASGTYVQNTRYPFLVSSSIISGTFDTVTPVPGLSFEVVYNNYSVEIVILSTSTL